MPKDHSIAEISDRDAAKRFVVNMLSTDGGELSVRSCEVLQPQFRNRTSFNSKTDLEDVFIKEIATGLQNCLESLSLSRTEVLSFPDLILEVPGLTLCGAQIMATKKPDGSINIIFRFKFFVGIIFEAFKPNVGFESFLVEQCGETSALVLSDLVMPILDLCLAVEQGLLGQDEKMTRFASELSAKSGELRFQVELIKRYVSGLQRDDYRQSSFPPSTSQPKLRYQA